MQRIVGVDKRGNGSITYYNVSDLHLKKNVTVIVEEGKGKYFGKVVTEEHELDETKLNQKLGSVLRIASKKDYLKHKENLKDAAIALKKCKDLVKKYSLDMNLLDAYYTFDRDQLIFRFFSDQRVDFRELARELASIYRVRIELRQIGVRDKAKEIGGIGPCGQELCCHRYLKDFDSVSISMAKNQNLALSPNKINGLCGRLLCCLKYENECYLSSKKGLPKVGETVSCENEKGTVIDVDILSRSYTVDIPGVGKKEVKL